MSPPNASTTPSDLDGAIGTAPDGTSFHSVTDHAVRLFDSGLISLPRWGGGNALPGTDHRALADNPPTREEVACADYSGGLAILNGTVHPLGGYVLGIDIDEGPPELPPLPKGFLYREAGTATGKLHDFVRTVDQLTGQILLRDLDGTIVAELKGRGMALRSWPTRPPEKPRGYRPLAFVRNPSIDPPVLSASQVADGLAFYLSAALGRAVVVDRRGLRHGSNRPVPVSDAIGRRIADELEVRGVRLRPPGRAGWASGFCPLHEDHHPSFSVSFQLGAWVCRAGCGSGGLRSLARRLRVPVHRGLIVSEVTL